MYPHVGSSDLALQGFTMWSKVDLKHILFMTGHDKGLGRAEVIEFLVQVQLGTEVLRTPSSICPGSNS